MLSRPLFRATALAVITALVAAASVAAAGPSTVWTRQFGTSLTDWVYAAAVDGAGNVFVFFSERLAATLPKDAGWLEAAWTFVVNLF